MPAAAEAGEAAMQQQEQPQAGAEAGEAALQQQEQPQQGQTWQQWESRAATVGGILGTAREVTVQQLDAGIENDFRAPPPYFLVLTTRGEGGNNNSYFCYRRSTIATGGL